MVKGGVKFLVIVMSVTLLATMLFALGGELGWNITGDAVSTIGLTILGGEVQRINLTQGWNFISFFVQMNDYDVEDVFRSIDGYYVYIQEWDPSNQDFDIWSKYGQKDFTALEKNKSYFIWVTQDIELEVRGLFYENWTIAVLPGWDTPNYVFYTSSNVSGNSFYGTTFDYMQKWNASNQEFLAYSPLAASKPFDKVHQSEGYLIRTNGGDVVYTR